ncbi:hypothetical protein GCM10009764_33840 [Nocardia ninae]|uniref:Uncharacterized protein n=1 Tax=Nocardia ninae NBRC 108245 TaxID=1210091 RepID=A0A511ML98_9NOCA|nr:hypothetical protein NN4_59190 [Nocardia ninae NBRC 108245]
MLLLSTRTGTDLAAAPVGVVGAGVVVGGAVVDDGGTVLAEVGASAEVGAAVVGLTAAVGAGACGTVVADADWSDPALSASDLDSDIAPSPPNTMASAINTIANARNGGPPEVGFG